MTDSIEQREREQFEAAMRKAYPTWAFYAAAGHSNVAWVAWQARAALSAPQAGVPEPAKRAPEVLGMFQHHCPNVTGHRGGVFVCQRAGGAVSQNSYCTKCECPEAAPPAPGAPAQVPAPGDSGAAVGAPQTEGKLRDTGGKYLPHPTSSYVFSYLLRGLGFDPDKSHNMNDVMGAFDKIARPVAPPAEPSKAAPVMLSDEVVEAAIAKHTHTRPWHTTMYPERLALCRSIESAVLRANGIGGE